MACAIFYIYFFTFSQKDGIFLVVMTPKSIYECILRHAPFWTGEKNGAWDLLPCATRKAYVGLNITPMPLPAELMHSILGYTNHNWYHT